MGTSAIIFEDQIYKSISEDKNYPNPNTVIRMPPRSNYNDVFTEYLLPKCGLVIRWVCPWSFDKFSTIEIWHSKYGEMIDEFTPSSKCNFLLDLVIPAINKYESLNQEKILKILVQTLLEKSKTAVAAVADLRNKVNDLEAETSKLRFKITTLESHSESIISEIIQE